MAEDRMFSEEELNQITIPIGLRTLEDIKAPLVHSGYFADLRLEHLALIHVSDACWEEFEMSGDKATFARCHTDMTRAWAGPVITSLIADIRRAPKLTSELFARFERRLAQAPRPHRPYMAAVVLSKRP
jgi:hypothetical protein